jgi:hypothetical protein
MTWPKNSDLYFRNYNIFTQLKSYKLLILDVFGFIGFTGYSQAFASWISLLNC